MSTMDIFKAAMEKAEAYAQALPPEPPPLPLPQGAAIAGWIDHTLLKPTATDEQIMTLCREAMEYHFAAVCVNPAYLPLAQGILTDKDVAACAVISFPLGAHLPAQKAAEARSVLQAGAREVDMVMNIGAMKSGAPYLVYTDIKAVADVVKEYDAHLKVIIETAYLTREEKITACVLSQAAGADFVKTSTGFAPAGATVEDVALMRRVVGPDMGVKAAGGIRTLADAQAMIRVGANRIGASAGVAIVKEASR